MNSFRELIALAGLGFAVAVVVDSYSRLPERLPRTSMRREW